jgi:hypothetical protein
MKQTTTNQQDNELSTEVLKQLAFMQYNGDDYFVLNGKAYEGDEDSAKESYEAAKEDFESFEHFCSDELDEVEEFNNDDYYVLTDEEADEKAKEYIIDSLWAFNPSFLASMTDFDEEVFQAIADNGKCESNNDVIYNTIAKTCGIDEFVEAAIQADGRGHFMSSYDGNENEETVQGETFYIYRLN